MEKEKLKKFFRIGVFIILIILAITYIATTMLKYEVEGEKNMPFTLSKLMIISNAEGVEKEQTEHTWDMDVMQNNDVYIEISKNKSYRSKEVIESVTLENFTYEIQPKIGETKIYRPSKEENKTYDEKEESLVTDRLEYIGGEKTDIKNLTIANQGGLILLRFANTNVTKFVSDEVTEVKQDGTLLKQAGIPLEDLKYKANFDLIITLVSGTKYKTNLSLDLPVGNLLEEGKGTLEEKELSNIVFKRM